MQEAIPEISRRKILAFPTVIFCSSTLEIVFVSTASAGFADILGKIGNIGATVINAVGGNIPNIVQTAANAVDTVVSGFAPPSQAINDLVGQVQGFVNPNPGFMQATPLFLNPAPTGQSIFYKSNYSQQPLQMPPQYFQDPFNYSSNNPQLFQNHLQQYPVPPGNWSPNPQYVGANGYSPFNMTYPTPQPSHQSVFPGLLDFVGEGLSLLALFGVL
jgi:hypothetical protein